MKFKDRDHEERYHKILVRMRKNDEYHRSAAYLMALAHLPPEEIFDFDRSWVKHSCLLAGWQTSSSRKASRLLLNLWNGTHEDHAADNPDGTACYYTVDAIMDNHEYFPWFVEAIRIRFGWTGLDD